MSDLPLNYHLRGDFETGRVLQPATESKLPEGCPSLRWGSEEGSGEARGGFKKRGPVPNSGDACCWGYYSPEPVFPGWEKKRGTTQRVKVDTALQAIDPDGALQTV